MTGVLRGAPPGWLILTPGSQVRRKPDHPVNGLKAKLPPGMTSGRYGVTAGAAFWAPALLCVILAGCAGTGANLLGGGFVAPYQPANALLPAGFSERSLGEARYEVMAAGTESTPPARVEKIAVARAAELGAENKFKYFKVLSATHDVTCSKKQETYKGSVAASQRPTVVLDVIYAKTLPPGELGYRACAATFQALKAELDGETFSAEILSEAAASIKARCRT